MKQKDVWLSANFKLSEFCRSDYATRMGLEIEPTEEVVDNLYRLCKYVLQPLRNEMRGVIRITSGYRPDWLNAAVGGSKTSAHMHGCAADIEVDGTDNEDVVIRVTDMILPYDQCILEYPPDGWVHIGIAEKGKLPRNEVLTAKKIDGKTIYLRGLVP